MEINYFGLLIVAAILLPNLFYALKGKAGFENHNIGKSLEIMEQISRFGCIAFMIIRIPACSFASFDEHAHVIYAAANAILVGLYWLIWMLCWKKNHLFRALSLSILPSVLFAFDGIMSGSVLLIVAAAIFAPSHILISYKNTL